MPVWRTTLEQTYGGPGGPGYSTLYFRHDGIGADLVTDLQTAMSAWLTAFAGARAFLSPQTTWRFSGLWQDVGGTSEVTTTRAVQVGNSTTNTYLPTANTVCLGWRTENRSRRGRGRTFLSGWTTNASSDGTIANSLLDSLRAGILEVADFNEGFANGAWQVYSELDAVGRDITGGTVRDTWASLRSRRD